MLRRGNKAMPNTGGACRCQSLTRIAAATSPGSSGAMRPLPLRRCTDFQEKEGYRYAICIKSNAVLEREIEHLLK
jgi:hypothetical protein